ncbi:MAG: hypothetical protein AVDCRST_MAG40-3121, partial [uncultured Gemmatimonadaceae bacterium]
ALHGAADRAGVHPRHVRGERPRPAAGDR